VRRRHYTSNTGKIIRDSNRGQPHTPHGQPFFKGKLYSCFIESIRFASFIAAICAIFLFYFQMEEFKKGNLMNAWQILTTRHPGDIAKGAALQTILEDSNSVYGIDLSCNYSSTVDQKGKCESRSVISNFTIKGRSNAKKTIDVLATGTDFVYCQFDYTTLKISGENTLIRNCSTRYSNIILDGKSLQIDFYHASGGQMQLNGSATVLNSTLSDVNIIFPLDKDTASNINVYFFYSSLAGSRFTAIDFLGLSPDNAPASNKIELDGVNISGVKLNYPTIYFSEDGTVAGRRQVAGEIIGEIYRVYSFKDTWYWSDMPPIYYHEGDAISLDRLPTNLYRCPAELRQKTPYTYASGSSFKDENGNLRFNILDGIEVICPLANLYYRDSNHSIF